MNIYLILLFFLGCYLILYFVRKKSCVTTNMYIEPNLDNRLPSFQTTQFKNIFNELAPKESEFDDMFRPPSLAEQQEISHSILGDEGASVRPPSSYGKDAILRPENHRRSI